MAGTDCLEEHGDSPEPEQQPDHEAAAEYRRPVGDSAAQAAAVVPPRDSDVQVDIHPDRVFRDDQYDDSQAPPPDPAQADGWRGAHRPGGGLCVKTHLLTSLFLGVPHLRLACLSRL